MIIVQCTGGQDFAQSLDIWCWIPQLPQRHFLFLYGWMVNVFEGFYVQHGHTISHVADITPQGTFEEMVPGASLLVVLFMQLIWFIY